MTPARASALAAFVVASSMLASCASRPRTQAHDAAPAEAPQDAHSESISLALRAITPLRDTVHAMEGPRRLALPIAPPSRDARLRCAQAGLAVVWIGVLAGPPHDRWIPSAHWVVLDASGDPDAAPPQDAQGGWFALLPRDSFAHGPDLVVGDAPVRVRTLSRPRRADGAAPHHTDRLLDEAALDARHRWRVSLDRDDFPDSPEPPAPEVDALASYADAIEARARAALERLAHHDQALAHRLRRTIARTVAGADSLRIPAFPPDDDALADVLSVLLDERVSPAAASDRAAQYLLSQPRAVAWIIDDAGADSGARIGVAELHGDADLVRASVTPASSCDPPTLDPLFPRSIATIQLRCRETPSLRAVEVSAGAWKTLLDASLAPAPASPPGLRLGPLAPTLTMRAWLSSRAAPIDARWASAALLHRRAGSDRWQLYIECLVDPSFVPDASPQNDEFRLSFGPTDAPHATLTVRPDADAVLAFDDSSPRGAAVQIPAITRREDDRWIVFVDLPDDLAEPDGTLLIGAERTDARGLRSTWPRPVFPWQDAPPRLRVDLSTWARPTRRAE